MYRTMNIVLESLFILALPALAAEDLLIGTWKLNPAKSKIACNPPGWTSGTYTFEASAEAGEKLVNEAVSADGTQMRLEYTARYDGSDYPETGAPTAGTVSLRRIDPNTTEVTSRNEHGRVLGTTKRVVSKDGRTLTSERKGTNERGRSCTDVLVHEKQ